jgi:hypothetical protein
VSERERDHRGAAVKAESAPYPLRRLLVVTLTALSCLRPAFAAVLSTTLAQSSLDSSPKAVVLEFSEHVDVRDNGSGARRSGNEVETGKPVHPNGRATRWSASEAE